MKEKIEQLIKRYDKGEFNNSELADEIFNLSVNNNRKENMKKEDYIKCIVSIMNFLVLYGDNQKSFGSYNMMTKTLKMYDFDICSFTEHISKDKLWNFLPSEFLSDSDKWLPFYVSKLNEYVKIN